MDGWIRIILSIFFVFLVNTIAAQNFSGNPVDPDWTGEKCAATLIEKKQQEVLGVYGTREYFEHWVDDKKRELASQPYSFRTQNEGVRMIPVVIHVIHNGTPIGEGANIPMSQIRAQIDVLNEDYRRLNPDAGNTPEEFLPVAADARVEFVMAKQDPNGLPSNGVNRVAGSKPTYTPDDAALIGQLALWPPEEYLNIWVVPLQPPYLGYSSFPISELPGLNFPLNTRETDGVTIDFKVFGEGGNALGSSSGRTATHEIGHYLGLRHIWGDAGGCEVDDFVEDTPIQSQSNNTCQVTPRISCESRDMIENFMDYTPDQCMNIFTQGQVDRIDVVLNFSPRRASLVNGRGTVEPELSPNDLALTTLIAPMDYVCSEDITPQVEVLNVGNNRVASTRMEVTLNGRVVERRNFSLNVEPGATALLTFNPISLPGPTGNDFKVEIISVNGRTDTDLTDNVLVSSPRIQPSITAPYNYRTADFSRLWTVKNPDNSRTWEQLVLPIDGAQQNMIYLNGFNYETQGELDYFISPQINLTGTPNAQLAFQMAFSPYQDENFQESLLVAVSTDCGNTFELLEAPYHKTGNSLATEGGMFDQFFPDTEAQFRTELVNLAPYAGHGDIRLAFISLNGYGNNLFIKNIRIYPTEELRYGFKLDQVLSPGPFVDGTQESETVQITNTGNLPIRDFRFIRRVNGISGETLVLDQALDPEQSISYTLPSLLEEGLNQVEYEILDPNFDQNGGNNDRLVWHIIQDDSAATVPWRQNFEGISELQPWLSLNPEQNAGSWEITSLQDIQAIVLPGTERGNSYWLGSPLFDLSRTIQASIFFDRAAGGFGTSDGTGLSLLISADGGQSYEELWIREGDQINSVAGSGSANPNIAGDYVREHVDLSSFTGEGFEQVRIAFKAVHSTGTYYPIFLDNIELFLSANPDPVSPELGDVVVFPNPATDIFNIAFNLQEYDEVNIQIISAAGQVVHDVDYPNTLNQTYSFSSSLFSRGVYIIKISRAGVSEIKRLIIQ